jgi:hypothetical protein
LLEGLSEGADAGLTFWIISGPIHKYTDPPHLLRLLRARRQRPRHC